MSVASIYAASLQNANGVKTDFDFAFKIFASTDLKVYIETGVGTGVYTLKTLTTHYTVTFDTTNETGTVKFLAAPGDGLRVKIVRDLPQTQASRLPIEGIMPAKTVENALDKAVLIAQELQDQIDPLNVSVDAIDASVVAAAASAAAASVSAAAASASASASNGESSGTLAARPATPSTAVQYYATDTDQLFKYSPAAAKWYLIG